MGKQGNRRNNNSNDHGNNVNHDANRTFSYRTLLTTAMNQVKAIRSTKTHSSKPTLNLLDIDIPTINLGLNQPEYEKYVTSMIQAYNRYLGYASGITMSAIKNVFKYSLDLFCIMRMVFRYYESNEMKLPTGEELNGIFDTCTTTIIDGTTSSPIKIKTSNRIGNTLKGISNKVWESDFISKVENILLPSQVITLYNYYLGSLFNISDNSSKEQLTFARVWVSLEDQTFITIPTNGVFPALTKSQFDAVYNNLQAALTPTVRDFICTFLGWVKPNMDWTRPITADRVYVITDDKFKSTFNMLFPEKVNIVIQYGEDVDQITPDMITDFDNAWSRYYYDFEFIGSSDTSQEFVAIKYYFGIDNINTEQYVMMQNEQMNDIIIDFNNYILASILTNEEIAGSKAQYVGGIYSLMTRINMNTGSFFTGTGASVNQIYMGNDLKLNLYDSAYDIEAETAINVMPSQYAGIVGDMSEVCEMSENIDIFNYPIVIDETWSVLWKTVTDSDSGDTVFSSLHADAVVNGHFDQPWDPSLNDYSSNYEWIVDHDYNFVACNTYTMDPNEVHLAVATTVFSFLTGFASYNEAIQFIDTLFRSKQQETK